MAPAYTALEQEVLDLLTYHRAAMAHQPRTGQADMLAELDRIERLVHQRAADRQAQHEAHERAGTDDQGSPGYCPHCADTRELRTVVRDDRDVVVCATCGTVVVELPRSFVAKLDELDRLIAQLTVVRADGTTLAEGVTDRAGVARALREAESLRKKLRQEQREQERRERVADERLGTVRDMLLVWKLRAASPGSGNAQA